MGNGAWIFLSHSFKDLDKVREIRNKLEEMGHNPLMFFLKCMNDNSGLDDLIKREIEARRWFVLCDSSNAKKSKWVQEERKHIESLTKREKKYSSSTINLNTSIENQMEDLAPLLKQASVYLSCSKTANAMVEKIADALRKEDFGVFDPSDLGTGQNWKEHINQALRESAQKGAMLLLLSQASLESNWQWTEAAVYALQSPQYTPSPNIIPIFLDSPNPLSWPVQINIGGKPIQDINGVDFFNRRLY